MNLVMTAHEILSPQNGEDSAILGAWNAQVRQPNAPLTRGRGPASDQAKQFSQSYSAPALWGGGQGGRVDFSL